MVELASRGIRVALPGGWDGHIYRRAASGVAETHDVLHAASFALPPERGDFGGGAVELMQADDIFISLFDYGADSAGLPLFAKRSGVPTALTPDQFDPSALQRTLPGQCGTQVFFTTAGRGFCLYVVLGSWRDRVALHHRANVLLSTVVIGPS